jgi:Cdc6-like AAA superfamily ATPase
MKTIKTMLLIVALTFSSVLVASTDVEEKGTESVAITEEIGKLLKNPRFILENDVLASVILTINKNNEIVVLSVDSDEDYIDNYIKSRLNYHELPVTLQNVEKTYKVPVRMTPEE